MDQVLFNLGGIAVTPSLLAIVVLMLGLSLVIRRPPRRWPSSGSATWKKN